MIPLFAIFSFRDENKTRRIWLPLFLLWLILLPFALILSPFVLVACAIGRVNPLTFVSTVWSILSALSGTVVDVQEPSQTVFIRIY